MGRPFWQEGSIIHSYKCYWALLVVSLLGLHPAIFETISYCLNWDWVPFFAASYDPQDYGGSILTFLHTGGTVKVIVWLMFNWPTCPRTNCQCQSYLMTDSQPIRLGVRPPSGTCDQFFFHFIVNYIDICGFINMVHSLWQEGGSVLCNSWPYFAVLTFETPKTWRGRILYLVSQEQGQNRDIKIGHTTFENVSQFKYLGMTVTNQNLIQEEIKRLNYGNACYHSVQNFLSSHLLSRNKRIWIYKTIMQPHQRHSLGSTTQVWISWLAMC
jgi:hypothetical protein